MGDKVMKFNAWAAEKKDKLASRWLGPYTIIEVHNNENENMTDTSGKVRATKVCAS